MLYFTTFCSLLKALGIGFVTRGSKKLSQNCAYFFFIFVHLSYIGDQTFFLMVMDIETGCCMVLYHQATSPVSFKIDSQHLNILILLHGIYVAYFCPISPLFFRKAYLTHVLVIKNFTLKVKVLYEIKCCLSGGIRSYGLAFE